MILDCTNLGRHLVLAAPILSLKLPTLVILNMADDLKRRRELFAMYGQANLIRAGYCLRTIRTARPKRRPRHLCCALHGLAKGRGRQDVLLLLNGLPGQVPGLA